MISLELESELPIEETMYVYKETQDYCLKAGNKSLTLTFHESMISFSSFLGSVSGIPKEKGATTRLFERAAQIMQIKANQLERKVSFTFNTEVSGLIGWAQDPAQGSGVFEWDFIYDNNGRDLIAWKIYEPQK